ncbi:MAG: hypothetical protein ACYC1M_02050 [Armatimonadota bacterium]
MTDDTHLEVSRILQNLRDDTKNNIMIKLDGSDRYATTLGDFKVQFEGEDDLLHLEIVRTDGTKLDILGAKQIADRFFANIPPALIVVKPAEFSAHYYLPHDILLKF